MVAISKIPSRIIFLDIDGVLNSHEWFEKREKIELTEENYMAQDIDPAALQRFQTLLADTGASVVLSSSWRKLPERVEYLKKHVCDIIAITPECDSGIRGAEIYMWWSRNKRLLGEPQYAIIDDDSDMLLWQKDNFFQTSFMTGLTEEICQKVRDHFNT